MKLDFTVPEVFLSALSRQGHSSSTSDAPTTIVATTAAWPDKTFHGQVSSVNSRIDPVTRSITVRARLQNPEYKLRPGLLMQVKLTRNLRQGLVIPEEALLSRGDQKQVMRLFENDGTTKVEAVNVELGSRYRGEVEIINGLAEGDRVITDGTLRVRPGSEVVIKTPINSGLQP